MPGPFKPGEIKSSRRGSGSNALEMLIYRDILGREEEGRKASLEKEVQTAQEQAKLGTRELSGDERSDLQVFDTVNKYVSEIESFMEKDPNKFQEAFSKANLPMSKFQILGDKDAINLKRSLDDWADLILRARSKSQTTEREFSRIRGFGVPTLRDITVTNDPSTGETFPTIRKMLRNVRDITENNRQRIIQGVGFESSRSSVQAQDQGQQVDPVEAIKQRFRQRNP